MLKGPQSWDGQVACSVYVWILIICVCLYQRSHAFLLSMGGTYFLPREFGSLYEHSGGIILVTEADSGEEGPPFLRGLAG